MKNNTKIIFLLSFLLRLTVFLFFNVDRLKKIPFFNSSYQDFDEIDEALYMIKNNNDPYELPTMFHV